MKKIITIIFIMIALILQAQTYPLNTSAGDIPDGAYLKDLDNELLQYEGLWKGTWNGKTIYIKLLRYKTGSTIIPGDTHPYFKDRIIGARKIINANGVVEIDDITNFNYEDSEFSGVGISLARPFYKALYFYPKNMCNKSATLDIKFINAAKTQMQLYFRYEPSSYDPNCIHNAYMQQYGDFPINFPKDIILTKQ